ncbi:hypothetical protein G9A89_011608 [Geosiphon pyriformis]|nr:hypothetical protein G9A89_011608 [Geosiphon pyriformis]
MKKTAKVSGSESGFKVVTSRKKRKEGVLAEGVDNGGVAVEVPGVCSWSSETGDTTESESVDMEEKCLVEKTSFDYGEGGALAGGDYDQMPMSLKIKTKKTLGKPLGKIDFSKDGNDDDVLSDTPLELSPSMKNLVNVPVKKSFALDIGLNKVAGKSSQKKLVVIRKLFSGINDFGRASTPSKFSGIIRATFTSKSGLMKATEKATGVNIMVNTNFKRSAGRSDWAVVLKEIPVGTSAEAVHAALSEFGIIKSMKMQLVGLWQKAVVEFKQSDHADLVAAEWSILIRKDAAQVTRSDLNKKSWDARDQHRALLYTLPMGMTAHDIWDFIGSVGGKTCVIDRHPVTYARARCAVICFDSADLLNAIMGTTPVLRGANLRWSCLVSAKYAKCGKSGHTSLGCAIGGRVSSGLSLRRVLLDTDKSRLAAIYANGSSFPPLSGQNASVKSGSSSELAPSLPVLLEVNNRFAAFEHSLAGLVEQNQEADIVISEGSGAATSGEIVAGAVSFDVSLVSKLEDSMKCLMETVLGLSAKVDSFGIVNKYDGVRVFTSGLESGYLGSGVAVIMNSSLARHVCKVSEVPGRLLSIKLLFKNKLSVSILGLYAGASSAVQFSQASEVNSLIAKAVNESSFVVLGGDFNEDGSHKCASFKKCLNLGLVNALGGSSRGKLPTWSNSRSIAKTIDFMFVSSNLVNAVVDRDMFGIGEYFDTDHQAVSVLVGLCGLLNVQLNSVRKQANRDCWKYDCKGADDVKWAKFKKNTAANAAMFHDDFFAARIRSDLDSMWVALRKVICLSAEAVFKKKWFKGYDKIFSKNSSKFHKLELLVSKLVRASHMDFAEEFASLLNRWEGLDLVNASAVKSLFLSGSHFNAIWSVLSMVKKSYCASKMSEAEQIKESQIRSAIDKRMKSFELDKGHTIRSVLERPFRKVTLDHLVVDDELVLEPALVKAKTRKHNVVSDVTGVWNRQYQPLEYVFDDTFSGVMSLIDFDKMSNVISNLPDEKAAGLSGISNELWKHCDKSVLDMLLVLLNVCLEHESEDVLINTHPIALVETARKILFKVLSDRISLACSVFDILRRNNFSVLKGMTMQSPIFAIRLTYDSVGWEHLRKSLVRIKMCNKFIRFFGTIHNDWVNRVIMDFGLTDGYWVHDGLDQREVFFPLLWHIFYDPLLCEVKRQKSVCRYRLDSHFVANTGRTESQAGLTSFLAAGAFVDDTIWIGSSQAATQHILNVATKRGESHWYLGIFLSTEGLSKPSLAKACLDVQFFTNLVLKKAISDKQFSYLVSAVLHPIIAYRTQFSFVPISVCAKWDAIIRKGLKSKSGLPLDFPNDAIHHSSLYGLKSFEQVQAESKSAAVVCFANSVDGSLCGLSTLSMKAGAAVFFEDIDLGLGVEVSGLISSTMTELQAIALALECVPPFRLVNLFSDSQATLDACRSELMLGCPDFRNWCWVKRHHISNVIHRKNLDVNWIKVRDHSGVLGNEHANTLAGAAASSGVHLPHRINECFLKAGSTVVSGNSRHFVHDVFRSIYYAHWEISSGSRVLVDSLCADVDWVRSCSVWHLDSHLAAGFTSARTAGYQTYFMKALHHCLSVAVRKRLYNKGYPSVMCLFCEISDHVFSCLFDTGDRAQLMNAHASLLSACTSNAVVGVAICKGFVFNEWYQESFSVFKDSKTAAQNIMAFMRDFCLAFCDNIWLVRVKHRAVIEKDGFIPHDGSIPVSVSGLPSILSSNVVRLLGITDTIGIGFGFHKSNLFFSGVGNLVSVHIGV